MAALKTDIRVPVSGDGWVQLVIDIADLHSLSDRDRTFVLSLVRGLGELAAAAGAHPGPMIMRQAGARQ